MARTWAKYVHARGERELTKGRSSLTHEKVIVNALLLIRELIAGEVFVDMREVAVGGSIARKGHRRRGGSL